MWINQDQFEIDTLMESLAVYINYFDQIKKVRYVSEKSEGRGGVPRVYLTR